MKSFTKSLLVIIILSSISMQLNPTKTQFRQKAHKYMNKKTDEIVKIWEAKKIPKHPITTLLAITEYDQRDYAYLYPKKNPLEKSSLIIPQVSLYSKPHWLIKMRSNPPFCDVEPLQNRIPVY